MQILALPLLLSLSAPGRAAPFTFTITNQSDDSWSEGLIATFPELASVPALLPVGPTPRAQHAAWSSYLFGHDTCDDGFEDDGDAVELAARRGLTLGQSAWVVPSLAPGASATVTIDARKQTLVSYLARVEGSDDDVVAMHVPGDRARTAVPLYNHLGLPKFDVQFEIGGYDLNSTDPTDGTAGDCSPDCPVSGKDCYVAPGNDTVGEDAGGPQPPVVVPRIGIFPGHALTAEEGTFYRNGVGSPSVVYRHQHDDYVMFFETRLPQEDPNCPAGRWGIGVAHSLDGWSWEVVGTQPVIRPLANSFHSCVAAHPTAVIADNGTHLHVWFKGEQGTNCDPDDPPPWGCKVNTGVGHARIDGTVLNKILNLTPTPFSQNQVYGFPSVVRVGGTWVMALARYPSVHIATATSPNGPWTLHPTPVLEPGVSQWTGSEVFNPALTCSGDGVTQPYPYHLWFGGRTTVAGQLVDGGIGEGISNNARSWYISPAPLRFVAGSDWRHWDALRVGFDDYLIYYSDKDAQGRNRIGLASTVGDWDPQAIATRLCPQPAWVP